MRSNFLILAFLISANAYAAKMQRATITPSGDLSFKVGELIKVFVRVDSQTTRPNRPHGDLPPEGSERTHFEQFDAKVLSVKNKNVTVAYDVESEYSEYRKNVKFTALDVAKTSGCTPDKEVCVGDRVEARRSVKPGDYNTFAKGNQTLVVGLTGDGQLALSDFGVKASISALGDPRGDFFKIPNINSRKTCLGSFCIGQPIPSQNSKSEEFDDLPTIVSISDSSITVELERKPPFVSTKVVFAETMSLAEAHARTGCLNGFCTGKMICNSKGVSIRYDVVNCAVIAGVFPQTGTLIRQYAERNPFNPNKFIRRVGGFIKGDFILEGCLGTFCVGQKVSVPRSWKNDTIDIIGIAPVIPGIQDEPLIVGQRPGSYIKGVYFKVSDLAN